MTLRERLGLSPSIEATAPVVELARCACRFPGRHYGDQPCSVDDSELPLGPSGYCWGCWTSRHDLPLDDRPEWVKRNIGSATFARDDTASIG
jgi:hypothetical protein